MSDMDIEMAKANKISEIAGDPKHPHDGHHGHIGQFRRIR